MHPFLTAFPVLNYFPLVHTLLGLESCLRVSFWENLAEAELTTDLVGCHSHAFYKTLDKFSLFEKGKVAQGRDMLYKKVHRPSRNGHS